MLLCQTHRSGWCSDVGLFRGVLPDPQGWEHHAKWLHADAGFSSSGFMARHTCTTDNAAFSGVVLVCPDICPFGAPSAFFSGVFLACRRFVLHLWNMNPGLVIIIAGVILLVIGLAAQIEQ